MYNKKDDNSKNLNFKEVEWDIDNIIRSEYHIDNDLSYKVSISALALVLKQTNDKETMMKYVVSKISNEATILLLKKVSEKCYKYIEELSGKYDEDVLKSLVLFSEPSKFTEVDIHSTPEGISRLAIDILDIKKEDILLDLGSGVSTFLIQADKFTEIEKSYGVEINTESVIIANIRSFIAETSIEVIQGNIVSQDFSKLAANKIFSNHPLGMRINDLQRYIDENPKVEKYFNKSKRTVSGDWVYNMAAYLNMKQPGKTVVLMTNAGTWNKPDEELRKALIEKGVVEGVILLPERLLSTTSISLTMMILSQGNNCVRMVDASEVFTEGRRQNTLESTDILKIVEAYNNDSDISRKIEAPEILEQEYILNPQRYIGNDVGIKDGIKLGELAVSINRGAMIKSTELDELSSMDETNYQYLMLKNIQDGVIDSDLPNLIEIDERYKRYCVKDNNLIISKLSPFKVARAYVQEDKEILATGNLYFIELDDSKINPVYVEVFLQSEIGMSQLNRYSKGSAMKSISIQDLKMIEIPNLPREKQDEIAEEYENLCDELVILEKQKDIISERKSKLLQEVI